LGLYTRLVALGSSSPSVFDKVLQDIQALINFELTSLSLSKPPTAATAKLSGSKDLSASKTAPHLKTLWFPNLDTVAGLHRLIHPETIPPRYHKHS
jgi:hypothetical protein